jgi:diadenosine tetraphosphate (Ap4A) HIT family hydrolase
MLLHLPLHLHLHLHPKQQLQQRRKQTQVLKRMQRPKGRVAGLKELLLQTLLRVCLPSLWLV